MHHYKAELALSPRLYVKLLITVIRTTEVPIENHVIYLTFKYDIRPSIHSSTHPFVYLSLPPFVLPFTHYFSQLVLKPTNSSGSDTG